MAYSLETMEDIRKSLIDTIAMVERENAMLTAKIDRLLPGGPSPKTQDDEDNLLEEFSMMKNIQGMSFKNCTKEILEDSSVKINAHILSGKEVECTIEIFAAEDGTVKDFCVGIEDTSSLMEIKEDLSDLIEDVNLSYTLKAISSFSRMSELRAKIIEDLLEYYEDFFKCELRPQGTCGSTCGPDLMVVSAHSRSKRAKYFEVTWNLRWYPRKMSIEHIFTIDRFQGLSRISSVEPLLKKLEDKHFVEGKTTRLTGLWTDIGDIVAQG